MVRLVIGNSPYPRFILNVLTQHSYIQYDRTVNTIEHLNSIRDLIDNADGDCHMRVMRMTTHGMLTPEFCKHETLDEIQHEIETDYVNKTYRDMMKEYAQKNTNHD